MAAEHVSQILKISMIEKWNLFTRLFEKLTDNGYELNHPLKGLDLQQFEQAMKALNKLRIKAYLALVINKKPHSGGGKSASTDAKSSSKSSSKSKSKSKSKVKIEPGLEIKKVKKSKSKEELEREEHLKYYNPEMSLFETCLTFTCSRIFDGKRENLLVVFSLSPHIGKPALSALESHLEKLDELIKDDVMVKEEKEEKGSAVKVKMETQKITNLLLISSAGLTPTANSSTIPELQKRKGYNIQVCPHHLFSHDPTLTALLKNCKHIRLSEKEANKLRAEHDLQGDNVKQMPLILLDEPIAMWKDYRIGDIIKITDNGSAHEHRLVVLCNPTA